MHITKSTVSLSVLSFTALSAALPAPEGSSPKAIAERANPSINNKALLKRAAPTIGAGIDPNDPHRGGRLLPKSPDQPTTGGFSNALELMSYATTSSDDAVFRKYFNPGDKATVTAIFDRLLGGDGATDGAAALANIQVIAGEDDPDDPAPAELKKFDEGEPNLVMTDDAFVYPDRDDNANACNEWAADGMSQDMYLLGSVLLHEYTHWDWFLGSIHNGEIIDQPNGYGWEGARALDKSLAVYNADSYGWYATENFWTIICSHAGGYNAPGVEKRGG
ncbi:hypothetical protein MMC21_005802 [Puttea exsequens]|nr:hypothetical protein [Puttea exsequens]